MLKLYFLYSLVGNKIERVNLLHQYIGRNHVKLEEIPDGRFKIRRYSRIVESMERLLFLTTMNREGGRSTFPTIFDLKFLGF